MLFLCHYRRATLFVNHIIVYYILLIIVFVIIYCVGTTADATEVVG